jgi:ribonuclease H2 subunit B
VICPKESKLILLDETCFDGENVLFCKLKHPRTGDGAYFAFSNEQTIVHEVLRFQESCRCWFNDNDVNKDGSVLITTPVDPILLILPYFEANTNNSKYMLLEQIVHDDQYPNCELLLKCVSNDGLRKVFNAKDVADHTGYCLSPDKLIEYLSGKVQHTAEVLQNKQIQGEQRQLAY